MDAVKFVEARRRMFAVTGENQNTACLTWALRQKKWSEKWKNGQLRTRARRGRACY